MFFPTVPVSNVKVNSSTTDILESSSSSVRLSCSSSGSSPSFLWLNSSSEVTASDRVQLTDGGSTLTIANVTRYDLGPFRCHVSNHFSNSTSDPVELLIICESFICDVVFLHFILSSMYFIGDHIFLRFPASVGPDNINLTISPSQEYYDEGSDVTLTCSAPSRPPVMILWFLNGDQLSDTEPELRLVNIQMSQSGNYSCLAFNNRTMRNQTSQPSWKTVQYAYSSEVTASERVQLTDGGSTLTIINVTRYDQGPFICHVFNHFSNYTSEPVKLYISYGPENLIVTISPSQEFFEEGSNISLVCSADSRPAALFQWLLNGDLLPDAGPELSLMNVQMNQSGRYSCQAFNNKTLRNQTSQPVAVSVQSTLEELTDGGSTLTIMSVTRFDQGPFRCRVSNGATSGTSQPMSLFIQCEFKTKGLVLQTYHDLR
uniref:Ig-like domain-containing protein n=1 Tax=Cyclopterus lumpus TaxID=8103 RepID=A0A8C2ZMA6_CYCLU